MRNYDDDGKLIPKDLICWSCGGTIVVERETDDSVLLRCKDCEEALGKLYEKEGDMEEASARLDFAVTEYVKMVSLYTDLQDYVKTLTR